MSQVPEESFTQAQYRNTFKKRFEFLEITVLGSDANGTHFQWDDARGERHFGVISDLTGILARRGSATWSMGLNITAVTVNVALSPALAGAIADYLIFATADAGAVTVGHDVRARLTTLSNLEVRLTKVHVAHTISSVTLTHDNPSHDIGGHPYSEIQVHAEGDEHQHSAAGTFPATSGSVWWLIIHV